MEYILESARLKLRKLNYDDCTFLIELLNSPAWLEYIGDRGVKSVQDAKLYLDNGPLKSYKENKFGLSLIELKETNTPIGMCGIIYRDNLDLPDIGFALLPNYIGKGYAKEIATETVKYANDNLNIKNISGITLPTNIGSIKVLESIGLIFRKTIVFPDSEEELLYFSN